MNGALITDDGHYDTAAIFQLGNANWRLRKSKGWNTRHDRALAFHDAWERAKAEQTRFAVDTGRTMPLTPLEARELATDGRL